ncbi:MAG TPA: hypothetical protein VMS08_02715 [Candidatus Saccharimonadia bacterium]|nr:hypothetical protein [Candidatus Saccharimonadia bacterium]
MNERIRVKAMAGKLADIKRRESNTLDIPAILRANRDRRNRHRGRKHGST